MGVPRAVTSLEEFAYNRLACEGGKGDGCDKLLAGRRDDDLYLCTCLDETTYDQACLIGCYGARNAKNYLLAC